MTLMTIEEIYEQVIKPLPETERLWLLEKITRAEDKGPLVHHFKDGRMGVNPLFSHSPILLLSPLQGSPLNINAQQ